MTGYDLLPAPVIPARVFPPLASCLLVLHYIAAWPRPTVATDLHIAGACVVLNELWWAATKGHDPDLQNKLHSTMKACSDSTRVAGN